MVMYYQVEAEMILFKARCICGALNVRVGPSTAFPKVDILVNGEVVNVYEERDNWFKIGKDRWCSGYSQYMEKIETAPEPPQFTVEERLTTLEERVAILEETMY